MKITICGSIAFYDEMIKAKNDLENNGFEVKLPPSHIKNDNGELVPVKQYYALRKAETHEEWIWDVKEKAMRSHFDKVGWSDAILVLNENKNGIDGYVGANTLLEMGLAFHQGKKIYLSNKIPEISYKEEILGMKPVVLHGDITKIK